MLRLLLLVSLALAATHCTRRVVRAEDERLGKNDGLLLYDGKPYSGTVETYAGDRLVERTPYEDGLIHGDQLGWHENGNRAYVRPHRHGKKVGAHRGWYPTGEPRHLFEFEDDQFHGEYWEWQRSGLVYKYARFEHGVEVGSKIWRRDGKIYANYVATKDRLLGLPGGNLCRIVEEDEDGRTVEIR